MRYAVSRNRSHHYQLKHGLWLAALIVLGLLSLPAAAAQADASWTGASTSSQWSAAANWTGSTPPTTANTAAGTLVFPTLGTCATCYTSRDGLTGISATGLVFGNSTNSYQILGGPLTLGTGGITTTQGPGSNVIKAPLALAGGPQAWTIGSTLNGYNSLTVLGGVTGTSAEALTVSSPRGDLFVDSDMEVGPVTSSGAGGLHIGGAPGTGHPGSVNATNGQPVTIKAGSLVINPGSTSGPLAMNGGTLLLGTNPQNNGTTTLQVNGAASLGSSTTTKTFINDNGSTPGTDFSQVSAGNITLGGQLVISQGPSNGSCVALTSGDVATLFTTTGTLSGTFANARQGATLTMASSCQSTRPQVQINYTTSSVTATVVGGATATPTTTTLATPNPSPAITNQAVSLTATVATNTNGSVTPAGTVAFSANGTAISGCSSQPVTGTGSSGTATCSTSFAASGSPKALTATFTGSAGSGQANSTSSAQTLTVNPGSTTTDLVVSNSSPPANTNVTYTATVTPGVAGAINPSGAVAFLDGGSPISGCGAQPVTAGSSSATATCTVSYPSAGSHTITATYGGDTNFAGSSSPATTVTVQAVTATFPTTPIRDTFAQSPGPLSGNWQSPSLQDAGKVSVATSGQTVSSGGAASAIWQATSFGANQEVYLTVPVLPATGDFFQVGGRVSSLTSSTVSLYFLRVTPSNNLWDLRKKLKGATSTSMGTFSAPFAAGDSAGLQLSGTTITAWHQAGTGSWTSVGSLTDTSITAGGYVTFTLGDTTMRGGALGGGSGS
jgi:hypothetical protein